MLTVKRACLVLILGLCACGPAPATPTTATAPLEVIVTTQTDFVGAVQGRVTQAGTSNPVPFAFVQAKNDRGVTVTVFSDGDGRYALPGLAAGDYVISSHGFGYQYSLPHNVTITSAAAFEIDLSLPPTADIRDQVSGAEWLSVLPDDTQTRQFILDCQGCHQLGWPRKAYNGWPTETQWQASIRKMLSFYGPQSGFPIIGPLDVEETAAWLAHYLTAETQPPLPQPVTAQAAKVRMTEYDFPGAGPHDLVLDSNGQIIITGMFSHNMYSLDPESGEFTRYALKPNANPRALELDAEGNWWIVFGSPHQLALFDPLTAEFETYSIDMYAHSVALDSEGNAWVNGHFLSDPGKVIRVSPDGSRLVFDIPDNNVSNLAGLPISYEIRVGPDNMVWVSDLNWNRIYKLHPETGEVAYYEFPHDTSGPRRFDIDADGKLWIPEFSGGRLAMFDPVTETFTEWEVPTKNAEPYVVKIDHQRGLVWIGYAAGNRVASFDPLTETFVEYPLPTPYALIRHMAIDSGNGDVWVSYHHVPTSDDKIVRLQFGT